MKRHLAGCPVCSAELAEMKRVGRLLDLWEAGPAPSDLWASVMAGLEQAGPLPGPGRPALPRRSWFWPAAGGGWPGPLLRDLAAAAVVSLVIFWGAGALLQEWRAGPGKSMGGVASAYTRTVDGVFARAAGTAGEYTRKIFFKEGNVK